MTIIIINIMTFEFYGFLFDLPRIYLSIFLFHMWNFDSHSHTTKNTPITKGFTNNTTSLSIYQWIRGASPVEEISGGKYVDSWNVDVGTRERGFLVPDEAYEVCKHQRL